MNNGFFDFSMSLGNELSMPERDLLIDCHASPFSRQYD